MARRVAAGEDAVTGALGQGFALPVGDEPAGALDDRHQRQVIVGVEGDIEGEDRNFAGNVGFLAGHGVEVALLQDADCIELMARFIREQPEIWNEDIVAV